jgi:hypothetical protein
MTVSKKALSTGSPGTDSGPASDPLGALSEAVSSYLEELDSYRAICLRHENTATAYATDRATHLVRVFARDEQALTHVRRAAKARPGWEVSPFWEAGRERREQLLKDVRRKRATRPSRAPLLCRGIAWEGRPMIVLVTVPDRKIVRLELILPPLYQEMPELALRTVASGLRCHEYLLPESVARALPPSRSPVTRALPLREYLTRATPQNLYASQCVSARGRAQ